MSALNQRSRVKELIHHDGKQRAALCSTHQRFMSKQLVPHDHFYRHLERTLDLSFVREFVQETYASGGRPSIDPIVFFKLQLVMFFEGIRSERQLMRHAADRLSVRWYIGYDLNEPLPDHSSLTRIRKRYGMEVFRRFFEAIVEQCQQEKLVWGQELYIDSTQVNANAALDSVTPRFAVEARAAIQSSTGRSVCRGREPTGATASSDEVVAEPPESTVTRRYDAAQYRLPLPTHPLRSRARGTGSAECGAARLDRTGRQTTTGGAWSAISGRLIFKVSTTDPDATPMRLKGGGTHMGYHTHYVVDGGKARIILQALVTPSEVMDNQPMRDLLWRDPFPLETAASPGDRRHQIWHHREHQSHGRCRHPCLCSACRIGKSGMRSGQPPTSAMKRRLISIAVRKARCCNGWGWSIPTDVSSIALLLPSAMTAQSKCSVRPVTRGVASIVMCGEEYVERVRTYQQTLAYQKALRKRQVWVEPLFAEAKDWHGLRRFRLRLLWRVNCEALRIADWAKSQATAQETGMGTASVPSRGPLCLFLGSFV